MGSFWNPWTGYRMCPPATHLVSPSPPSQGVEKSLFHISANRLKVVKNANLTHFSIHWLVVKWCHEQSYSFQQSPKRVKADRAQYAWSSSNPITIVVTTLLFSMISFLFAVDLLAVHLNLSTTLRSGVCGERWGITRALLIFVSFFSAVHCWRSEPSTITWFARNFAWKSDWSSKLAKRGLPDVFSLYHRLVETQILVLNSWFSSYYYPFTFIPAPAWHYSSLC